MEPAEPPEWERLLSAEQTARVQRPVTILGRLDGVMTGIRQLRRTQPLEVEVLSGLPS